MIPAGELVERYSRSSGPGGQSVNTTDSRVQLSFDIKASRVLTDLQRERALQRLAARLDGTTLTIDASEQRSQFRNRTAARDRLAEILRGAFAPPPPKRRATRPTRGSIDRRLTSKSRRGILKRQRGRPSVE